MKRKIVQLFHEDGHLHALCNDGTILWWATAADKWRLDHGMSKVPQDKEN